MCGQMQGVFCHVFSATLLCAYLRDGKCKGTRDTFIWRLFRWLRQPQQATLRDSHQGNQFTIHQSWPSYCYANVHVAPVSESRELRRPAWQQLLPSRVWWMGVVCFLMNEWERLWEEDGSCDSWRNRKLALLSNFVTITNVYRWVICTVGVWAVPSLCVDMLLCACFCVHLCVDALETIGLPHADVGSG